MSATSNLHLKVPFSEKDQAKSLGAKWNAELKLWYVPQGLDATPFKQWFSSSHAPTTAPHTPTPIKNKTMNDASSMQIDPTELATDDLDAINARLRNAYESGDLD